MAESSYRVVQVSDNEPLHDSWLLIPARGGSKGIPNKNVRPLAGSPLLLYSVHTAASLLPRDRIVVSTDDDVIAHLVAPLATIHRRTGHLAGDEATLDEVALEVARWLVQERDASGQDLLLTVQPTSPFLRSDTIVEAFARLRSGASSIVSVRDDRHLRWTIDELGRPRRLFAERVNRQWLPPTFTETGGLIGTTLASLLESGTRIVEPVELVELDEREGLDIDSHADWAIAEFLASRRRIVVRADGAPSLGMGHAYRALALAQELSAHDHRVVTRSDGDFALGAEFFGERIAARSLVTVEDESAFFEFLEEFEPDIVIADVLDTTSEYVARLKALSPFVVTIEDLGEGSLLADVVINDLYTDPYPSESHWYGVQHALLGPQFEAVPAANEPAPAVGRILVSFGGSDPADLTRRALEALQVIDFGGWVDLVLGPGYSHGEVSLGEYGLQGQVTRGATNLALLMHDADLAITSAGRTVTELMTQGIPTVSLCQNARELLHTHASSPYGVANLGLGTNLTTEALAAHLKTIIDDHRLRVSMHERMLKAVSGRTNHAIVERILKAAEDARDPVEES